MNELVIIHVLIKRMIMVMAHGLRDAILSFSGGSEFRCLGLENQAFGMIVFCKNQLSHKLGFLDARLYFSWFWDRIGTHFHDF